MRAWYHNKLGFSADLCELLYRKSTRLIVRNPEHGQIHFEVYPTWQDAINALMSMGDEWINDLTEVPLLSEKPLR